MSSILSSLRKFSDKIFGAAFAEGGVIGKPLTTHEIFTAVEAHMQPRLSPYAPQPKGAEERAHRNKNTAPDPLTKAANASCGAETSEGASASSDHLSDAYHRQRCDTPLKVGRVPIPLMSAQQQRELIRGFAESFERGSRFPTGLGNLVDDLEGVGRNILHIVADQLDRDQAVLVFLVLVGPSSDVLLKVLNDNESGDATGVEPAAVVHADEALRVVLDTQNFADQRGPELGHFPDKTCDRTSERCVRTDG